MPSDPASGYTAQTRTRAEAALLGTTLIWGGTFTVVKIGMEEISPILLIAVRFFIATLFILLIFRKSLFPIPTSSVVKGSILGLFLFLGFVAQNIGLTITTASKSAFITGMMVVFVPVLQLFIERRAPKLGNILGVAVVTLGLWFLTSPTGSAFNAGDAFTLVCALFFAGYIVYLDVISKEMTTQQLVFLQMASTGVLAALSVLLFETPVFGVSVRSLGSMAYLTFLATIFTTYIQTRFQKETTPTRAVVIFSIEPVIASAIAARVLGEQIGGMGILGGGLILAGVLISELADSIPLLNRSIDLPEP